MVSARRVAVELGIKQDKANMLCWALERHFYAPGGVHYRVSRRSLDAFKELLETGRPWDEARELVLIWRRDPTQPISEVGLPWRRRRGVWS